MILDGEEASDIHVKLLLLAHEDQEPFDEYNINEENLDVSSNSYTSREEVNIQPHFLKETVKMLENEMAKMYKEYKTNKKQTDNSLLELSTKVMSLSQIQSKGSQDNSSIIGLIQSKNSAL